MTKCYGCGKEKEIVKWFKVEYERERQPFCKECSERLIKIKLGLL